MRALLLIIAFGTSGIVGVSTTTPSIGQVSAVENDSVLVTLSTFGDARPRGELHTLILSDAVNPSRRVQLIASSVLTRADTVITTLPAKMAFGTAPMELWLRAGPSAPDLQFVVDIVTVGSDTVGRCIGTGRALELVRLPEGSVLHRVDGNRPLTCGKERR